MADWPIRNYVPAKVETKAKIDPYSFKYDPYNPKVKSWELKPAKTYDSKVPKAVTVRPYVPAKTYEYKEYIPPWERGILKTKRQRLPAESKKDEKKQTTGRKSVKIAPLEKNEEGVPNQSAVGSVKRTMMLFNV